MWGAAVPRVRVCVGHVWDLPKVNERAGWCLWQDIRWVLGLGGIQAQLRDMPDVLGYGTLRIIERRVGLNFEILRNA